MPSPRDRGLIVSWSAMTKMRKSVTVDNAFDWTDNPSNELGNERLGPSLLRGPHDGLERLSPKQVLRQALTPSENRLSPSCLHASHIFEATDRGPAVSRAGESEAMQISICCAEACDRPRQIPALVMRRSATRGDTRLPDLVQPCALAPMPVPNSDHSTPTSPPSSRVIAIVAERGRVKPPPGQWLPNAPVAKFGTVVSPGC